MAEYQMDERDEVFEKLIHPITKDEFFSEYWGKRFLHIPRNDPSYHAHVASYRDVEEYLARNDLRYPYIRLVKEGRELPLNNYARDRVFGENLFQGNLDLESLFREYAAGATMCMQLQHLALPTLGRFTEAMERYFGYRTQSTIFVTPADSHGFTRHYDSHDFFTMGVHGQKTWRIYADGELLPLPRTEVLDSDVQPTGRVEAEITVKAGDTLYVPRGVYHDARGEREASMQVSFGVFPYYWCDLIHSIIDDVTDRDPLLREAVVPTKLFDAEALRREFDRRLAIVQELGNPGEALARLQRIAGSKQLRDGHKRLSDLDQVRDLTPTMRLKARDVAPRVTADEHELKIEVYDKAIRLPVYAAEHVHLALSGEPFCANDLPDSIDIEGRLFLAKKLVTEGLVTILREAAASG